jgi:hypothetical protein
MKRNFKFTIEIIIIFICITIIPSISAFNNLAIINNKNINYLISKKENNFIEIITFIEGSFNNCTINKRGVIRDIEIYSRNDGKNIFISGWRMKENNSEKEYFYQKNIQYIHSPQFLGLIHVSVRDPTSFGIIGFAFGDIDWHHIYL